MEIKISDMMDHIQDDSVQIRTKEFTSPERIKEVTMATLHTQTKTHKLSHKASRVLMIAAALVMILSISALAAFGWPFSLNAMQGEGGNHLSLNGIAGMPEYEAALEWESLLKKLDANELFPDTVIDNYSEYSAFSQEAKDSLDSLLKKYGLRMHKNRTQLCSIEELYAAAGAEGFMPVPGDSGVYPVSARYYDDGTFTFNCAALLPDGTNILYNCYCQVKGTFTRLGYLMADANNFEEWSYTTEDGTAVLLAIGNNNSILAANLDNCFVFVHIRSGTVNNRGDGSLGAQTIDKSDLEAFSEGFDFTVINGLSA